LKAADRVAVPDRPPVFTGGEKSNALGCKYHSPFSIIAGWNGSDVRSLGEERILDFSTSWQVTEAFGMRLQLSNLTDEPLRITRDNDGNRLGSFDVYGRRALLDFTFKF
jgi:hypothetical protein